jgi:hypothetical protein
MPIPGVTEVTVEGVRLSKAALERAERMYAGYAPWVGPVQAPPEGPIFARTERDRFTRGDRDRP